MLSGGVPRRPGVLPHVRTGTKSVRITVREGDIEQKGDDSNRTERAELDSGRHAFVGSDVWYGFSFLIPRGFFDNYTLADSFAAVDPAGFDQQQSASR